MNIQAKKSLGQHFLNSAGALSKIISASALTEGETVLEIGPGTGILTAELLKVGVKVVAVEKDSGIIDALRQKFSVHIENSTLRLIEGDILEIDPRDLGLQNEAYALVANIPYYITGAILEKFLENEPRPNRLVLLVQKEVADRILAKDGKESLLSISVKTFAKPRFIAKVPKGAFIPPPTVDSAIIAIENVHVEPFFEESAHIKHFFEIVKAGFAHKRKYLIRNLESVVPKKLLDAIWADLKLDPKVRAEDIVKDKWTQIAKIAENVNN